MKKANRAVICEKLLEGSQINKDLCVLVSDSRGSASLTPYAQKYPERTIEMGIAEQNLVSAAAGLASMGKRPFAASPASFLTMRSVEQIKVDVAYSHTNVKLIGISAGITYGALGGTHHSLQDLAVLSAIPGLRVFQPADAAETEKLMDILMYDEEPAYIRVGRNPVEQVHENTDFLLEPGKALVMKEGNDLAIAATGETVRHALQAADALEEKGIHARVLNFHTIKPLDEAAILAAAAECGKILSVEEHSVINGLGSQIAAAAAEKVPCPVHKLGLPDAVLYPGESKDLYALYGLDAAGIEKAALAMLGKEL